MNMQQKKVCVIVTTFAQGQPGFLDFSYRIGSLAVAYDVLVISRHPLTQTELQFPGVRYVVIPAPENRMGWLSYLWRCAALIRKQSPAVAVLLHSLAAPVALLIGKTPAVVYWNEHPTHVAPDESGSPIKAALRWAVRRLMFLGARAARLVMPIGEAHRDDLLAQGCRPDRTRMLYMGVDDAFKAADSTGADIPDQRIRLIYAGSVHQDRGRDVMLEAVMLANRDKKIAHLTIVGASPEQLLICRAYVQRHGIEDSVTLHGRVPGSDIPAFYRRADIGVCLWEDRPWYRFNPPTKLFEYLVAGLPVLASDIRTHTEYVKSGVNGLIFEYGSAGMANALTELWAMRERLPQMKRQALLSSEAYRWEAIEPKFLEAVDGVAQGVFA
jgi:glycosyltransferase involved in cell wall biosynthesis